MIIPQELSFQLISESQPDVKWKTAFQHFWPAYKKWFLKEGIGARQTYWESFKALKAHMPELVGTYETLVSLAGSDDLQARFLSYYCPPPYMAGCSQAVYAGSNPLLVRNYDYSPALYEAVVLHSQWNGQWVIGMSDGLFGLLDGMNESGLTVSLTFGGRTIVGDGFGVPLIIRYILETCRTTKEAESALKRVPCYMAYNVTVIDRRGHFLTAHLSPDKGTIITSAAVATNHQEKVEWHQHAKATATVERERYLLQKLVNEGLTKEKLIAAFMRPPLYSHAYQRGFGTLYTASYWPQKGMAEFRWPGEVWAHRIGDANEGVRHIRYPELNDTLASIY